MEKINWKKARGISVRIWRRLTEKIARGICARIWRRLTGKKQGE